MKAILTGGGAIIAATAVLLFVGPGRGEAMDYGHVGQTFPVIEPDLLSTIEARLRGAEASGELARMRQADQWSTAPTYTGGGSSFGWRQDNGAMVTGFGNGREVFDTSAAISRLGFTPTMTTGSVAEWREMASEAHRQARAYENAANEILTATHANRSMVGTSTEHTRGWDSSSGSQSGTSVEQFDRRTGSSTQGTEERSTVSQSQRVGHGHDRQAQVSDQISGGVSARIGGGSAGRGPGAGSGINGGWSKSGTQLDALRYTTDDSRSSESGNTSSSGVRDEHASGSGASTSDGTYERGGVFARAARTSSSSVSTEDSLALAKSYSETARRLDELSQQLSRDASYAETHGMQLSENLSQDLAQWYREQQVANPGLNAPELWATDLTDQQRAVRQESKRPVASSGILWLDAIGPMKRTPVDVS